MKKIVSAKEQWMNDMNDLRNKGYECDACCDELGANGENEFYQLYDNNNHLYFFEKCNGVYKKINALDIAPDDLLYDNWRKLAAGDDWYNKEAVFDFLLFYYQGIECTCPIDLASLVWMEIYDNELEVTVYEDKEIEVSNEEIEIIRKEIVERCKGHSIEEVREMFDGYNRGEYGEGSFDFVYEDFIFSIQNTDNEKAEGDWFLSCIVCNEWSESDIFETTTLPIPPKEIKIEEKKEDVKEKPKYDGGFLAHVASIFREGHRVILVDVSGVKYVLNGLFDNEDVIIDCYEADTMKRIDRYFVIGAQDEAWNEADAYAEHFMSKIVKERLYLDAWFLTDKQFEFLKNA